MSEQTQVTLDKMRAGQSGMVMQIQGGHGFINRLAALGIRVGKKITKISSMLMRGPVTVQVDRTRIAIGYGMAKKITIGLGEHKGDVS
jgi:ferrous iron transport protein A